MAGWQGRKRGRKTDWILGWGHLLVLNPKAYVIIALFSQFLGGGSNVADVATASVVFTLNNLVACTLTLVGDAVARLLLDEANARHLNRFFEDFSVLWAFGCCSPDDKSWQSGGVFSIQSPTSFKIDFLYLLRYNSARHTFTAPVPKFSHGAWECVVSTSGISGSNNLFGQINAFFRYYSVMPYSEILT